MATQTNRFLTHLDTHDVRYELIHHKLDFSAQHTAADTHTPGHEFAKTVVLTDGEQFMLLVIPAHHRVNFAKAHDLFGDHVTLASEEQIADLFPDCEIGAEPPFGNLYNLPVYVSPTLANDEYITFNAGTHHEAVRMRYEDFDALVKPRLLDIDWMP